MLIEFCCSNHRSFKDEADFSMLAGTDTSMEGNLFDFSNHKVLRTSVIYGANGSGKSSLVDALYFMRRTVCNSFTYKPDDRISQCGFKLNSDDAPSKYGVQFAGGGIRYVYGFSIVKGVVKDEYLFYFPNGKKITVFERDGMEIKLGNKYKGSFARAKEEVCDSRLFVSCAARCDNVAAAREVYRFFDEDLVIYTGSNNWIQQSLRMMKSDPELKELFVKFMKSLGTDAKDIEIIEEPAKHDDLAQYQRVGYFDSSREVVPRADESRMKATMIYENLAVDLDAESDGVRRMFQLVCPIIDILRNDKVLVCDELENSLHESIICQIVRLFQDRSSEKTAQLIFTTHDTSFLDADLFRRDQVWFTKLTDERATKLYSLVQIKDVRKYENKGRQYMNGKYGAIPKIDDEFFENLKNIS